MAIAHEDDNARTASLLAAGVDANVKEPTWGQTPLMVAAARGRADAVRALLKAGQAVRDAETRVMLSGCNPIGDKLTIWGIF